MEHHKYDPYYRNLPANVVPARTPFTRPGQHDAGHLFIYLTNKRKRWSLLLDKTCTERIYTDARQYVPGGLSQFWLLEKRYSTHPQRTRGLGAQARSSRARDRREGPTAPPVRASPGRLLVVLREPHRYYTQQGDVLSYHFEEPAAIAAAEAYTRRVKRRAIVGLLLWDEIWL
jgi:hypothetical protein